MTVTEQALPELPSPPEPESRKRGRRSRAKGQAFEQLLDRTFAYYSSRGYALIEKTPEPMKVIRPMGQGRFLACYTSGAQPDYKGTIKGGRTVMYEAKYTEHDRLLQNAVSEGQTAYMEEAEKLGARCWVVCGFASGKVYRVPWGVWKNMKRIFGHKYVTEKEIEQYQVSKSWNDTLLILN